MSRNIYYKSNYQGDFKCESNFFDDSDSLSDQSIEFYKMKPLYNALIALSNENLHNRDYRKFLKILSRSRQNCSDHDWYMFWHQKKSSDIVPIDFLFSKVSKDFFEKSSIEFELNKNNIKNLNTFHTYFFDLLCDQDEMQEHLQNFYYKSKYEEQNINSTERFNSIVRFISEASSYLIEIGGFDRVGKLVQPDFYYGPKTYYSSILLQINIEMNNWRFLEEVYLKQPKSLSYFLDLINVKCELTNLTKLEDETIERLNSFRTRENNFLLAIINADMKSIKSISAGGVNLLCQRWVHEIKDLINDEKDKLNFFPLHGYDIVNAYYLSILNADENIVAYIWAILKLNNPQSPKIYKRHFEEEILLLQSLNSTIDGDRLFGKMNEIYNIIKVEKVDFLESKIMKKVEILLSNEQLSKSSIYPFNTSYNQEIDLFLRNIFDSLFEHFKSDFYYIDHDNCLTSVDSRSFMMMSSLLKIFAVSNSTVIQVDLLSNNNAEIISFKSKSYNQDQNNYKIKLGLKELNQASLAHFMQKISIVASEILLASDLTSEQNIDINSQELESITDYFRENHLSVFIPPIIKEIFTKQPNVLKQQYELLSVIPFMLTMDGFEKTYNDLKIISDNKGIELF
ncbi:MAG: hypothetical protein ISQ32_03230, partial [Rickettsiales bacterium]|nr:hypothetical protein [Rickettsiales bacterium]